VATQTPVKPCPFNSLTRLTRADTIDISDFVGSSTQVGSYSGSWPTGGGEEKEARLVVFAIEPLLVPSLKRRFQGEVEKIEMRARLDAAMTRGARASERNEVRKKKMAVIEKCFRVCPS
jgi:hypothetical protein